MSRPGWRTALRAALLIFMVVGGALGLLVIMHGFARGAERVDTRGNRTGSAVVDREAGRVELYDRNSNRTGYGTIDQRSGRVETLRVDGRRSGATGASPPARGRR